MPSSDDFYYRFEQRFRGSREDVARRLAAYLPIIEPLKSLCSFPKALDLGCGRGEWLELVSQHGYAAQGVDMDDAMLAVCAKQGLHVSKANAVDYLRSLPDASLALITGFHIAEHLQFDDLRELIRQAHRVLMPAGILILETPNPENLVVGACNFYTDPTHRVPLPPHLLHFLGEDTGFYRCKILRLNHPANAGAPGDQATPSFSRALAMVSPDYSLVAQTEAAQGTLATFDWFSLAENAEHGVGAVFADYDQKMMAFIEQSGLRERDLGETKAHLSHAREEAQRLTQTLAQRDRDLGETKAHLSRAQEEAQRLTQTLAQRVEDLYETKAHLSRAQEEAQRLTQTLAQRERELQTVYASRSWRVTTPLRLGNSLFRQWRSMGATLSARATRSIAVILKAAVRPLLVGAMRLVLSRPHLKARMLAWVRKHPGLEARLRQFAGSRGLIPGRILDTPASSPRELSATTAIAASSESRVTPSADLSHLTPDARHIYSDLNAAIEQRKRAGC